MVRRDDFINGLLRLAVHFQKSNRRLAASLGLTANELHCLIVLELEHPCCARKLAEEMGSDPTRVSKILLSLDRRGLIDRRLDTEDHRKECVTMTKEGRELISLAKRKCETTAARVLGTLSDARQSDLIGMLWMISSTEISHSRESFAGPRGDPAAVNRHTA